MPVPLDEYPIHQAPISMKYFGTSDRNVYDRCIMHCFRRDGAVELITGLGVYPHVGVIDAYATVRRGDRQVAVRTSDALGDDRMTQAVGPIRIEVLEPLRRLRVVCDADEHGLGFDLEWEGAFPPGDEPRHIQMAGDRTVLNASRFMQVGRWSGTIRVDGEELAVDDVDWSGTRDRSWGIRPVGEPTPAGRPLDDPAVGNWWLWCPLRFDDFAIFSIAGERADGYRYLNEAFRIWPADSGRAPQQLGWPEVDIHYRSGTRHPEHASLHFRPRMGEPFTVEIDTLTAIALNIGAGYGDDGIWSHGKWMGKGWTEGASYDLTDAALAAKMAYTISDHVARATLDGAEGWGIFEHSCIGRHDPSGFADLAAVAP
jgi:hypothetical protein